MSDVQAARDAVIREVDELILDGIDHGNLSWKYTRPDANGVSPALDAYAEAVRRDERAQMPCCTKGKDYDNCAHAIECGDRKTLCPSCAARAEQEGNVNEQQEPTPAEQRVIMTFKSFEFGDNCGSYFSPEGEDPHDAAGCTCDEPCRIWRETFLAALREYGAEQRAAGMREAEALARQWGFSLMGADDDR